MKEQITLSEIEEAIDRLVRPELALHGGDIRIESYEDGVLRVRLLGHCSGCPSAELTMESIVREKLTEALPGIGEIVLAAGVSDELLDEARRILKMRHQSDRGNPAG